MGSLLQSLSGLTVSSLSTALTVADPVFRPPQWSSPASIPPALTMTATDPTTKVKMAYVFDTLARIEHTQDQEITKNPVQSGAALTDHAYIIPAVVLIEILMSDSVQSFTVGQWANAPSKSVSAYETLIALQAARTPIQLATRLRTYTNMLIRRVIAPDVKETLYGLRALVTFEQIITANLQITSNSQASLNDSTRPQSTATTTVGQTNTQPVPDSVDSQNNIQNASGVNLNQGYAVPGGGTWSSYPTSGLANIFP